MWSSWVYRFQLCLKQSPQSSGLGLPDVFGYPGTVSSPSSEDIRPPGLRVPGAPRWYTASDLFARWHFPLGPEDFRSHMEHQPSCCPSSVLSTQLQLLKASLGEVLWGRSCGGGGVEALLWTAMLQPPADESSRPPQTRSQSLAANWSAPARLP